MTLNRDSLLRQGSRAEREAHAKRLRDEGMLLREIGAEMGVSLKTVHHWLTDPGGAKLRARKASYAGTCELCGGATDGSNGRDKAPTRCAECLTWTPEAILAALRGWGDDNGGIPPRGCDTEGSGHLPHKQTVAHHFGTWNAGLLAAGYGLHQDKRPETTAAMVEMIRAGVPTREVADRFGVGIRAVSMRLTYHGTPIRQLRRAA